MNDDVQAGETANQPTNNEPAAEPTLEDVYKSVQFESAPQPAAPAPAPQYIAPQPVAAPVQSVPDPYDTDAFKAYMAQQQAGTSALQGATVQIASYLSGIQKQEAERVLKADIETAVKTVNDVVKHDKPKVVEAMIDAKAREDSRFRSLWDNRAKNPTAWNNALRAVAKEIATDLSPRVDPQLRRSQQALRASQSQMATTQKDEPDDSWENMSESDFSRKWEGMVNRGA